MVMCRPGSNSARAAPSLLHDLPAAVGLLAGGAVAFLGLAADGDGLLELAAIGPVGLIGGARHHRSGGAGIGILPVDALAGAAGIERRLRRLVGIGDVALIERLADLRAEQAAGDDAGRGHHALPGTAAELIAEQAAEAGADERATGGLVHADLAGR